MACPYDIKSARNYSIAIVGGGICGLCTAIGLLHQDINVEIYEAAPAFSEIGAGVSIGPNAARALKMIDPAAYAGFLKVATNNAWEDKQKLWFSFRTGDIPSRDGGKYGIKFHDQICETGQSSVHRARFLDELVALVPNGVAHFGKKLVNVDEEGDAVILHFADGTSARHTAAIGCDGVKSVARRVVLGKNNPATEPTFSGKYAYRGLVPMHEAAEVLGDELARNSQMYLGHGGHILTFPIEGGKTMNVVAFGTQEDGKWDDAQWVKPVDKGAMFKDFEGWIEPVQQILGLMRKTDIWGLFDHPPAETYFKGRVCLLGDSAHASTPHNGAGAGQAIEDALIISQVMKLVYDRKDITRAFRAYDSIRRPRSQALVKESREMGFVYDMQAPAIGDDLEKLGHRIAAKRWLWDHDLELDVREVERLYRTMETTTKK